MLCGVGFSEMQRVQHILCLTFRFWPTTAFEFFFYVIWSPFILLWPRFGALAINPLNAELNPICHLLALLGAYPILHISRIRFKVGGTIFYSDASAMFYCITNKYINSVQHVAPLSATWFGSHEPWWENYFYNNLKNNKYVWTGNFSLLSENSLHLTA